jgi:PAS domain S-box-containing protein
VAVLRHFPPQYSTDADGRPEGFAVDVIKDVARLMDAEVTFVVKDSWGEVFEAVRSGEADLIPNQGITAERMNTFAFTAPVETFSVRIFVRASANGIQSLDDLTGRRVAVVQHNVGQTLLEDRPQIISAVHEHVEDALFSLLAGKVDAVVFPAPVLLSLARRAGIEDLITAVGKPLTEIKRAISVLKDNTALLQRLNAAVARYIDSPTYQDTYTRHYGKPPPFITIGQAVGLMGGLLVVVVVSMVVWRYRSLIRINRDLTRSVAQRLLAESALREAHDRLEERVRERTEALAESNRDMAAEIERRTHAEALVREKEQFLSSVFDAIQDGISVLTPSLEIVRTNQAMKDWYASHQPLTGKRCYEVYQGRKAPCEDCPTLRAIESRSIEMQEVALYEDGREIGVLELYAFPINGDNGAVTGVVEYVRDISKRKKVEASLADSKRRLADIIDFLPDPTWVIDIDGRVIAWNRAIAAVTGILPEDILGKGDYAYSLPFYESPRPTLIDLVLRRDERWEKEYLSIEERDGLLVACESFNPGLTDGGRFLSATAARLYDAQGNVVGAIETFRDVTDAKLAEQERERLIAELREALAKVRALSGMLPISSSCKKIRDDKGYWNQIEKYIRDHSEAEFSHGICPECVKELYPDLDISTDSN